MKNVLITGATGGIGSALVNKYCEEGYNVFASGTNDEKLSALENKYKPAIKCFKCDLSQNNEIEKLIEFTSKACDQIDILINNAGITNDNLLIKMTDDEWNNVININLNSNFKLTRLALKGMVKNRWGRIVNITSAAAKIGNPGQANYVATKAALEGFTRTIANEVASRGITANCVSPGFVNTDILESVDNARLEKMLKKIPTGRMGETHEIANAVFFLTTEESSYITGQVLHVNGGLTM